MYHNYFGLTEPAFSIAVNPQYLYMSQQHKEALAHLIYGVKGGGFVLLSGEVGTGKTTIIRCLLEQLPQDTDIAIVLNPMAKVVDMLFAICEELGVKVNSSTPTLKQLTDALYRYLLDNHRKGRNTVLLIDEAQLLPADSLEQIRLLTNLETTTQKLLQIILVGQPEINELLSNPRMRQLSQRITARFHLKPLSERETQSYIVHRLGVAGMPEGRNPFPPGIVKRIHGFTGGIPRLINIVCERSLIGAYGHNKPTVDKDIFEMAKQEVVGNVNQSKSPYATHFWRRTAAIASSAAIGLSLVVLYFLLAEFTTEPASPPTKVRQVTAPLPQPSTQPNTGNTAPTLSAVPGNTPSPKAPSGKPEQNTANYFFSDFNRAQTQLIQHLGHQTVHPSRPCWSLSQLRITCEDLKVSAWDDLSQINRPSVLSFTTAEKFRSFAILIGIQERSALLLSPNGEQQAVELAELGPLWTGEVFYIWQRPPGFDAPLGMGSRGTTVKWLAEQFAVLDDQPEALTDREFNQALEERVKIFQRLHNLEADGLVGRQTLLRINEALGLDTPLIKDF